ncbi:Response regulator receiver sensor signal transduction histidine kinase [Gammaproteobacteria bacterium]
MNKKDIILIVDDIPENLRVLGDILECQDYEVQVSTDGTAALKNAMAIPPPDLILLDIMMPVPNGFEICRRLKANLNTRAIPVIFLSALHESLDKVTAFKVGGVDYITKPFQTDEVLARVHTHLELHRQRQSLEIANTKLRQALLVEETLNRKLIEINEKLRRSELLKSRFLSSMHKEIDYPLGSIIAMANQLSTEELLQGQVKQLANRVQAEAFDLDFQIRNIFLAAELEAGDAQFTITLVDVRSILQDAIQILSRPNQNHATVYMEGDHEASFFETDAEKLKHIIVNLLSNAIKFSPAASQIRVCFRITAENFTLEVEDEGPGIPEEHREIIFERFRQLETITTHSHRGHGLGLAVVKATLDLLGGNIQLNPGLSGGSCFTVIIPRPIPANEDSYTSSNESLLYDDFEEK